MRRGTIAEASPPAGHEEDRARNLKSAAAEHKVAAGEGPSPRPVRFLCQRSRNQMSAAVGSNPSELINAIGTAAKAVPDPSLSAQRMFEVVS